jgi:small subunit ribosomal protein S16
VAVKIRLKRMGKIRAPYYRVVVVDSRKKRDGRVIEEIGKYHPKEEPSVIDVTSDRAQYWLGVGAQPSEAVEALLKITGDWQKFKGLPGTEGTLRFKEPKRDKAEIFNEALKDSASEPKAGAVTKKASKKTEDKPAVAPAEDKAAEAPAEDKAAEAPAEDKAAEAPATDKAEEKAAETEAPAADTATDSADADKPAEA